MSEEQRVLRIGLPAGSMQESTIELFRRAGFPVAVASRRSYAPSTGDPELEARFIRAQEMARYVEHGVFDCGLTGYDWVIETEADVVELSDLAYAKQGAGKARWVLVVPEESEIVRVEQLQGKRIATELVGVTKRLLAERGVEAEVEFSWGATEAKLRGMADAVVDITETGSSLRANRLRIVETLLETTTRFIANHEAYADAWKRRKMENIALLLEGALRASAKVGLKMNARREGLSAVLALLPALQNPTVSALSDPEWVAVETIVDEATVREIIPALKAAGASGIIEYPLNKVIP